MRELKDRFQRKALLRAFLMKSIFNGGEVNYLTVLEEEQYRVFLNKDVVRVMGKAFEAENSKGDPPEQKVIFKADGLNVGELEMRNDSAKHYQEVRFNMLKPRVMDLLFENFQECASFSNEIIVYGEAIKKFGNWNPEWRKKP